MLDIKTFWSRKKDYSLTSLLQNSAFLWTASIVIREGQNEKMVFASSLSDFSNGLAVWRGSTGMTYQNPTNGSWVWSNISTSLTLTITDSSDNPITLIDPASVGGPSSIGMLAPATGDFTINILFEAWFPVWQGYYDGGWQPLDSGFSEYNTYPGVYTYSTVNGGFYYTAVPIPSAVWLLGGGLIGLVALKRRKK